MRKFFCQNLLLQMHNDEQPIEVLEHEIFIQSLEQVLSLQFKKEEINQILIVFQNPEFEGFILLADVLKVFELLGLSEKIPKNNKVDFNTIDAKSVRILNRINLRLDQNKMATSDFFSPIINQRDFKTKDDKVKMMECIEGDALFKFLHE